MGKKKKESAGTPKLNDKDVQLLAEGDTVVTDQENVRKKQKKKKHSKDTSTSEDQTDPVPNINKKQEVKRSTKGKQSDKLAVVESEIHLPEMTKGCEDGGSSISLDVTAYANEKSKKKKRKGAEELNEDLPGESISPKKKKLLELPCASSDKTNLTLSPRVEGKSKRAKKEKEVEESDVKKTDDCHNEKQNDDGLEDESFIPTKNSHQKKKDKKRKKKSKAENEGSFSDDEPEKKVIVAEECNERSEKKQTEKYNNEVIQALKESAENHSIFDSVEGIDALDNIDCKKKKKKNKDIVHYLPVCYDHAKQNCEAYQEKQTKKETIELKEADQIQGKGGSKEKKSKKEKAKSLIEADITDSPKSLDEMNCVETEEKKTNKRKQLEPTVKEETIEPKLELSSECGETKKKHKMKKKSKKDEKYVHNKLESTVKDETKEPKLELSSDCGETKEKHKMKKRSKNDEESLDNKLDESPTMTTSAVAIKAGQWNTSDMFESNARQEKFLRLLGGFRKANENTANGSPTSENKKGLFGSLKAKAGGQSALTYQAAQLVEKRLESDFEKALGFKGQRGVGLGFTPDPAEGKKFHININKTASKKFDD